MRKLIIINENDFKEYDIKSIKNNENADIFIWKSLDNERTLLKLLRRYNRFVVIGDKYLYETLELLANEKPFCLFNFKVEFLTGNFYKKYYPKHNLGTYLYQALAKANKRADK